MAAISQFSKKVGSYGYANDRFICKSRFEFRALVDTCSLSRVHGRISVSVLECLVTVFVFLSTFLFSGRYRRFTCPPVSCPSCRTLSTPNFLSTIARHFERPTMFWACADVLRFISRLCAELSHQWSTHSLLHTIEYEEIPRSFSGWRSFRHSSLKFAENIVGSF